MIEPGSPTYIFGYEKLELPVYRYVKDSDGIVHKIRVTQYVTRSSCSDPEDREVYAQYQVQATKNLDGKVRRILNVVFDRPDRVVKEWIDIESRFYSSDFYSFYSPSGLVSVEHLHQTEEGAQKGEPSYIFRDYNLKIQREVLK